MALSRRGCQYLGTHRWLRLSERESLRTLSLYAVVSVAVVSLAFTGTSAQVPERETVGGAAVLPSTIPIFPLEDVVLFPDSSRPLHIFEPRYRDMVADALAGDGIIGMVLLQPGYEADYEGRPPVYEIGCAGLITDAEKLPDGRYLIVLDGLVKFRVIEEHHGRSYRFAEVESMPELIDDDLRLVLSSRRAQLAEMLTTVSRGSSLFPESLSDTEFVDTLAQGLQLDPAERQMLLERENQVERAEVLMEILSQQLAVPL